MTNDFLEVPGDDDDYDMDALELDEAFLSVKVVAMEEPLYLYSINDDCNNCPYQPFQGEDYALSPDYENATLYTIDTKYPWTFLITNTTEDYILPDQDLGNSFRCDVGDVVLGEFGVYEMTVTLTDCDVHVLKEPVYIYGGLIIALAVYLALAAIVILTPTVFRKLSETGLASCCRRSPSDTDMGINMDAVGAAEKTVPVKQRVKSLDSFRGLSIALMIFVNYSAGGYWFLEHATWDGLQVADLVFPWFMWIMGVCIPMGLRSAIRRKTPKWKIFYRIFKRSVKLFFLGIILNSLGGWMTLSQYRVPGVLQRFAICYLVVSSVALFLPELKPKESKIGQMLGDVFSLAWQWVVYLAMVLIHVVVMFYLPIPDCPTGYIGPGGIDLLEEYGKAKPECIGGATGYIDKWLLGQHHLYQNPTAKFTYSSGPFDPEGVFGSIPSVFQVFLGLVAGNILHHHKGDNARIGRWLIWSAICGVIGTILCFGGAQGAPIPVNKNLWSLSYVMVTSCFAFFLLAVFYLLIDKLHFWNGSPLYQAGMNSIFLYVGHMVTYNLFPWHYIIGPMRTHAALLAECLWGTSLWIITALYLHHIGKFYTV